MLFSTVEDAGDFIYVLVPVFVFSAVIRLEYFLPLNTLIVVKLLEELFIGNY